MDDLEGRIKWQTTPEEMTTDDLLNLVIYGIEELYRDTGRESAFSESDIDRGEMTFDGSFNLKEKEYILLCAEILFFQKVQTDSNTQVSYTTDALSVTHGDAPYKNLADTISDRNQRRRRLFYKMTQYVME